MKAMRVIDFGAAAACIAYGAYSESLMWVGGGVLGLVIAAINPAERVANRIKSKRARPAAAVTPTPSVGAPDSAAMTQVAVDKNAEPVSPIPSSASVSSAKRDKARPEPALKAPYRFY